MELRKKSVFLLFMFLFVVSCSVSKSKQGNGKIIKGNYEISKTKQTHSGKAQIVCTVYDKRGQNPIPNAVVEINELKLGGETSDSGTFSIDIPPGKYTVTAMNVANTKLTTDIFTINPGDIIHIKFELGTTIIYNR